MRNLLILLILVLCSVHMTAENTFQNPDKVYLHLDRSIYAQGDTIWLKGYVMNRGTNKPSNNSYAIHVQMLDDKGEQVSHYKLLSVNGEAKGQIELFSVLEPGFYQLVAHTGYMKNFDQRFFFKTTIEVRERIPQRTISASFDKEEYTPGEEANVTFEVVDQNQAPVPNARFIYEYKQDGEVVKKAGVKCYDDGTLTVKFPITESENGELPRLTLRYLAKDGDIHHKRQEICLPVQSPEVKMLFFPEGGDLVNGLVTKVAFKATDALGNALDVEGELYKNGEKQGDFSTHHHGMGMMSFVPEEADYTYKVTSPSGVDSVFHLPEVKAQGYKLAYLGQTDDQVILSLSHNYEGARSGRLWISYCDSLLAVHDLQMPAVCRLPMAKADLPSGIVTFTISDENNVPQAERLVYVEKQMPELALKLIDTRFQPREKVELLLVADSSQVAHLSCAVVDSALAYSDDFQVTSLKAYAELESELKGYIPHLNSYMGNGKSVASKRDLLLMTHGWRHFDWFSNNKTLSSLKVHNFNRVFGDVTRMGKPYPNANIGAYVIGQSIAFAEFVADENGRFFLDPAYESHSYKDMMIVASNKKGRSGVSLAIRNTDTLLFANIADKHKVDLLSRASANFMVTPDEEVSEQSFLLYKTHTLSEFEISADRRDWDMSRYLGLSEDVKLGVELEHFDNFEWMLTQTSNSIVTEGDRFTGPRLQGADGTQLAEPLIVRSQCAVVRTSNNDRIDFEQDTSESGMFISYIEEELFWLFNEANPPSALIFVNDEPLGYNVTSLDYLRKEDVIAVAVLDGNKAYERFGTEAYYGAIMVYVSPSAVKGQELKRNQALFGDFVAARRFPEQLYDTPDKTKKVVDDKRVTLHWEPLVKTNDQGEAKVSFYTSDIPGKKQIIVQGFDDEGNLYYQTESFVVRDLFK